MIESKDETDSVIEQRHTSVDEDRQDHRAKVSTGVVLKFDNLLPVRSSIIKLGLKICVV